MVSEHFKIDINAYITNIQCNVNYSNGIATAEITFNNLGYGIITAIKFNSRGFNSFNDIVSIEGSEKFYLIFQNLSIEPNKSGKLTTVLSNPNIKKLELIEDQICLSDGSVLNYEGENIIEYDIDKFERYKEGELLTALREYEPSTICMPKKLDVGWVCLCGYFNKGQVINCLKCNKKKDETFFICSEEGKIKALDEYRNNKEKERVRKIEENKRNHRKSRQRKIKWISASLLGLFAAIAIFVFAKHIFITNTRTIYNSENEMKDSLHGFWTFYTELGDDLFYFYINDNSLIHLFKSDDTIYQYDIVWHPSKGSFTAGGDDYIVTKDGFIIDDKYTYIKDGSPTSLCVSNEDDESEIDFFNIELSSIAGNTICTGTVVNKSDHTYSFIKIIGNFKNSAGRAVKVAWTYAVGNEGLDPGESVKFTLSVNKDPDIASCEVEVVNKRLN
ncbi:MAG: hypothetical protein K0S47_3897 [Herbinix sp.]|jgi:hypothetical protein|nr:hypothetical protein [Herbinix sp.]